MFEAIEKLHDEISRLRVQLRYAKTASDQMYIESKIASMKYAIAVLKRK